MMKIVMISCFLDQLNLPISLDFVKLTKGHFLFVSTEKLPEERLICGYKDYTEIYPWVWDTQKHAGEEQKLARMILDADIVILGCASENFIKERVRQGKITYRYAERYYKEKNSPWRIFRILLSNLRHFCLYNFSHYYLLNVSYFGAWDAQKYGAFLNKCYKWGYFTETKYYEKGYIAALKKQNPRPVLLWAGRMVAFKHPEMVVYLAEELKKKKYDFEIQMIGSGIEEEKVKNLMIRRGVSDKITMLGAKNPVEVRQYMEKANIFLFPSDYQEGWGVVLNEAMNSGCAVVASHTAGSVGFLLKHRANGLIFRSEDQKDFNSKVMELLDKPELQEKLGQQAYQTITEDWNEHKAMERLLQLTEYLNSGKKGSPFASGICSVSSVVSDTGALKEIMGSISD